MKIVFWTLSCCMIAAAGGRTSLQKTDLLGKLPLRFEENKRPGAKYIARGTNYVLNLSASENQMDWKDPKGSTAASVHTYFRGANSNVQLNPVEPLPGVANYFLGTGEGWRTNVAGYGSIRYTNLYDGVDLVFHGERGRLEYDFILAPHADPNVIRLELSGQQTVRVDASGDLVIATTAGDIHWKHPEIYQESNGRRTPIDGHFVVTKRIVRFEVGTYDPARQLVIDPVLVNYSTYLGGAANDVAKSIALDSAGNIYISGGTTSTALPVLSASQPNFGGLTANFMGGDAFVAKFSPSGTLLYLTYLGGSADDGAVGMAVDSAGNAYITGLTTSSNFPLANPYQSQFGGISGFGSIKTGDAFVTKLNPTGDKLIYSTYLGGSRDDIGTAIVVDSTGSAYITGATLSQNFPTTSGAYQGAFKGSGGEPLKPCCAAPAWDPGDAFVVKLNPAGSQIVFATLLGGYSDDIAFSIALDASNSVYVGGCTISPDFPVTPGAFQKVFGGIDPQNEFIYYGDGFVAKLNPTGTSLMYSTFVGGIGDDCISSIAVDATGSVYMTGSSSSTNLPTTPGAYQPKYAGYYALPYLIEHLFGDAFVGKLNPTGTAMTYLTYLGGAQNDAGTAIAIDSAGNAYVTGWTDSLDFPLAGNPIQTAMGGDGGQGNYAAYGDAFLALLNPTGTSLLYGTYFGGDFDDIGWGIALDGRNNVYLTGNAMSDNLKVTTNAFQKTYGGKSTLGGYARGDAFLTIFSGFPAAPPAITLVANAEGENPTIGPNTWVEIKGTGLAPDTRTWLDADFVNNQMPTSLDNVTVTMNGAKAYVYYISPTQVNVLTPPDLAPGPVQVQVSNAVSSSPFQAQAQATAPSLFVFNGGHYVVATHTNAEIIGPPGLFPTSPALTTPAKAGETIVIYGNGFGPTVPPVTKGSAAQNGTLPVMPVFIIGNARATVSFAGLISPGLYQFNVVVPSSVVPGDNVVSATYNGATTQSATLLTIAP